MGYIVDMEQTKMNIVKAALLVAKDQRRSYPDFGLEDSLEHAYSTVNPETLDSDDEELYDAYHVFLDWRSENGPIVGLPRL